MFQLVRRDEYNSTSIVKRSENIDTLIQDAKKLTSEDNIENALTYDEKLKNWQSGFVQFFDESGEPTTDLIFAGHRVNKFVAFSINDDETEEVPLVHEKIIDPSDKKGKKQKPSLTGVAYGVKIFIGYEVSKKGQTPISIYATDNYGKHIDYVVPELFEGKNVYYIQVLK